MTTPAQAEKPAEDRLSKQAVRIALLNRRWVQADLARSINRSITSVNLAINHGMFPKVVAEIRSALGL